MSTSTHGGFAGGGYIGSVWQAFRTKYQGPASVMPGAPLYSASPNGFTPSGGHVLASSEVPGDISGQRKMNYTGVSLCSCDSATTSADAADMDVCCGGFLQRLRVYGEVAVNDPLMPAQDMVGVFVVATTGPVAAIADGTNTDGIKEIPAIVLPWTTGVPS